MKSDLDIKISLWTGFIAFALLFLFNLDTSDIASKIPTMASSAVSLTVVARFVFLRWAWKWRLFRRLEAFHRTPLLEGRWCGTVQSNGNAKIAPTVTSVSVEICQPDIHRIQIKRNSAISKSTSFAETFIPDLDGSYQLAYSYLSEPLATSQQKSPISYGTAKLNYSRKIGERLEGNYWTDQGTTGVLEVERVKDSVSPVLVQR